MSAAPPVPSRSMPTDADFGSIVTERLTLRRSVPEDAEAISAYRSDPQVHRHQGWDRTDPEAVRASIEEMAGRAPGEPGGWVQFSVHERGGDEVVGDVGLSPAEDEPGVIKVGFTMSPAVQGRGYATEAVGALIDYALDELGAELRKYVRSRRFHGARLATPVLEEQDLHVRSLSAPEVEAARGGALN